MKSTFAVACFVAVNSANANLIENVKEFWADIPVTRQEAIRRAGRPNLVHREPTLTSQHMELQAHHNIRAQRERLGLPIMGAGSNRDLADEYTSMGGLTGLLLGMANGIQYNAASGVSDCFTTVEGLTNSLNSAGHVISHIYLPWYAPEGIQLFQDSTALMAGFYTNCKIDKLITSLNGLASVEGMSTLASRGGTSLLTLGPQFMNTWKSPDASSFEVGRSFGKLFSAVTNFTI